MNTEQFSSTATHWIDSFDNGAHRAIGVWREGGERLGQLAKQRWDAAFAESSAQLSAETRRHAAHAQEVFGSVYGRGIALGASGAEVAVTTVAQAARTAVERAAAWQQSRA